MGTSASEQLHEISFGEISVCYETTTSIDHSLLKPNQLDQAAFTIV